jgi:hypothetical protein
MYVCSSSTTHLQRPLMVPSLSRFSLALQMTLVPYSIFDGMSQSTILSHWILVRDVAIALVPLNMLATPLVVQGERRQRVQCARYSLQTATVMLHLLSSWCGVIGGLWMRTLRNAVYLDGHNCWGHWASMPSQSYSMVAFKGPVPPTVHHERPTWGQD